MEDNAKTCGACGHVNDGAMAFCGECGAKLETPESVEGVDSAKGVCPNCGHVNLETMRFCGECGTPLIQQAESAAPRISLTMESESYALGAEIKVTATGVSAAMRRDRAFIGLYKAGDDHGNYQNYRYPESADETLTFDGIEEPGAFEMRLFSRDDGEPNEACFVTSVPFSIVTGGICPDCGFDNPVGTKFCGGCGGQL